MRLRRAIAAIVTLFVPLFGLAQLNTTRVMEIGRNALYFEDYVLSIQYFNKVIDAKPFLHEPYFYRGLAKFYLDDFVGADEDLTQSINRNPYVARSYQLRGLCRANLDSLELAEQDIRTAIKYDPQNLNMWQNLAGVVMQAGEWERAAGVVDSMLVFAPRNSAAYVMRTQVAMNLQDPLTALAMANKAVMYDKYSASVYDARSMVHHAMGAYEEAEKDLDRSIDLLPGRSNSYANRGLVRYFREDLRGALSDFDMAVYTDTTSLAAHYNRGLLLMEFGDNNKAIKDFNMVLGVDPDNTLARFNRALLRSAVGDYKGAVADLSVVIDAYPNFEQAYSCRAEARRMLGDINGAKDDEAWLFKRRQEIYFYGVESVKQEYSADDDATRKRSDENVRNYNKMIVPADENTKQYVTEARGKVQNRNVYVELEPLFVLTFYRDDNMAVVHGYNKLIEELNARRGAARPLILTNKERALTGSEAEYHFTHINDISSGITASSDDAVARRERALDYYLLQDIEAAMSDADKAVEAAPGESAELYHYGLEHLHKYTPEGVAKGYYAVNGMTCVVKCADNSVVIIDGGDATQMIGENGDYALADQFDGFLHQITGIPNGEKIRISCWYLTHCHDDHQMGFSEFIKRHHEKYELERVLVNVPPEDDPVWLWPVCINNFNERVVKLINEKYPHCKHYTPHSGDIVQIADVKMQIMLTFEDMVDPITGKTVIVPLDDVSVFNDTSTVVKMWLGEMTAVITGDITPLASPKLVEMHGESLKTDIIQAAHHGGNLTVEMYEAAKAKYVFVSMNYKNVIYKKFFQERFSVFSKYSEKEYYSENYGMTVGLAYRNGKIVEVWSPEKYIDLKEILKAQTDTVR